MKSNMRFYYKFLIGIILPILLSSCYPELKIARAYIESNTDVSIMVLPTNFVFKKNLKTDNIKGLAKLTEPEKDSALLENSLFLKNISDSIFLETFINSLIIEFEKLGFQVFTESQLDSFLFISTPAYILNIAQIELEEHYTAHKDQQDFDDLTYYKSMDLNALTYNFWFEFSELNKETETLKLFYTAETIHDVVSGYFTENAFTGDVKYKYNLSEIDLDILYRYCDVFGKRYAGYTFDYLMNRYISNNWPADKKRRFYMHYKRANNSLDPTVSDRFIPMKNQ